MTVSPYDDIAEWYDSWVGTHSMREDAFFPAVEALGVEETASVGDAKTAEPQLSELVREAGEVKPEELKARLETLRDAARKQHTDLYDARWESRYKPCSRRALESADRRLSKAAPG